MDWRPIDTAPRDGTHILLRTADFGAVEGWWETSVTNFYKSQEGWASYDPENMQGDWVSDWQISAGVPGNDPNDFRLFCGATPLEWAPLPKRTTHDEFCAYHDSRNKLDCDCGVVTPPHQPVEG
jgi:hypothetical protein